MLKKLLFFIAFSFFLLSLNGQGSILPLGNPAYHSLKRLEVLTGQDPVWHSSLGSFLRGDIVGYAMQLDTGAVALSPLDKNDLTYIFKDNNDWHYRSHLPTSIGNPNNPKLGMSDSTYWYQSKRPFLKHFYKTPANLFEVNQPDFIFRVNPMLNLKYGNQQNDATPNFLNQRGIELRGSIDDRIHFYTNIVESQANFAPYLRNFIDEQRSLPKNGFYKEGFASDILNFTRGYDFLNSQAYIAFNVTDHVGVQFGYGRQQIGNGYRSMLLSDFSNNYLHLKLNWRIWKLHFQNIFAELNSSSARRLSGDQLVPKKYMAAHYLSFDVSKNFEFGLFETVIFNRDQQFELQYLNPVILYRTIEQSVGSPDNVLIGVNAKWNLWQQFQLYGQFILDEFKFDELIINQDGWWGNKYGLQVGVFYPNVLGVDHLDAQLEYNTGRPYTYTHFDSLANYTHYGLPLANPLGANFREVIGILTYQPHPRIRLEGRLINMSYGLDTETEYFGRDWNRSYISRIQDYGNETGQGVEVNTLILGFDASYSLAHNVFLDLHYFLRDQTGGGDIRDQFISAGIRVNMANFRADF